ncbi:methyltransferase domain-containing protein [Patescibacteria group bacterium]|nr:methyltransferase domain-containing protein [Patescibacteria group bacterium]
MKLIAEIDPNTTPKGRSLDEIRRIAQQKVEEIRFFSMISSRGYTISGIALPTVYFCDDFGDSRYFAENVPDFAQGRFLEIGCGTGIVILSTALANKKLFAKGSEKYMAIDISLQSVKNAKINAMINGLEDNIDVRQGDVFEPLEENEKFDSMFWAHPFHKGNAHEDIIQRACFDPLFQGLEKYVQDGHRFLSNGGRQLLGSGNFADMDDVKEIIGKHECEMHLMHYAHRPFRGKSGELNTYNIYEIKRKVPRGR